MSRRSDEVDGQSLCLQTLEDQLRQESGLSRPVEDRERGLNKVRKWLRDGGWLNPHVTVGLWEGYRLVGGFGARLGPQWASLSGASHEMAHAIICVMDGEEHRLSEVAYGLRIRSGQTIGGQWYPEAQTRQATELECRVFGVQRHIVEACGIEVGEESIRGDAETLETFMPDWSQWSDGEEGVRERMALMEAHYRGTDRGTVVKAWGEVCRYACLAHHH